MVQALQIIFKNEDQIKDSQNKYKAFRSQQRERLANEMPNKMSDEEFWKSTSEHAPETRVDISRRICKTKGKDKKEKVERTEATLFNKDGRPLNINQAKVDFQFKDSDPNKYILDVAVYK